MPRNNSWVFNGTIKNYLGLVSTICPLQDRIKFLHKNVMHISVHRLLVLYYHYAHILCLTTLMSSTKYQSSVFFSFSYLFISVRNQLIAHRLLPCSQWKSLTKTACYACSAPVIWKYILFDAVQLKYHAWLPKVNFLYQEDGILVLNRDATQSARQ